MLSSMSGSSPAVSRLWRPAAQRNLRNQWSKLASLRQRWASASSTARSHATSLVNSFLSLRYMPSMELGVLSDMPDIRNKASLKLFKQLTNPVKQFHVYGVLKKVDQKAIRCKWQQQQLKEHYRSKLLSSYKDMVSVVNDMVNSSRSMRCFLKGPSSSPLVQFSSLSEDTDDNGDGGGIPVFAFLSVTLFEKLAEELVEMFKLELNLKRLLVMELLSISCEASEVNESCWSNELYPGEFDCLRICNLYETCQLVTPGLKDWNSDRPTRPCNNQPNQEMLQVYLTTWLAEVNIDTHRFNEIFNQIGEEMHVSLLRASTV